jgi:signal peptidase II
MKSILIFIALIFLDYFGKEYSSRNFKNKLEKKFFRGNLVLCYVENRGIAFNFLNGKKKLIISLNLVLLSYIIYLFFEMISMRLSLLFIFSGGIGNLFDRIKRGYVVDYIFFRIKKWPVFNLSDFYVFFGVILSFFS